jgi:hypothetical protein
MAYLNVRFSSQPFETPGLPVKSFVLGVLAILPLGFLAVAYVLDLLKQVLGTQRVS